MLFPKAFFLTGTDTGIGKTMVAAMLAKGLGATYWKPIQSGLHKETDTEVVKRLTQLPEHHFCEETYRLTEPLSPHASAAIDDVQIEMQQFVLPAFETDHLIVEGAGGVLVPLNEEDMIIDLIAYLNLPTLIVARSELGTLNHTFLTLEALRNRDIPIMGVIMNGPKNESNSRAIEYYGQTTVLAEMEPMKKVNSASLQQAFEIHFNKS